MMNSLQTLKTSIPVVNYTYNTSPQNTVPVKTMTTQVNDNEKKKSNIKMISYAAAAILIIAGGVKAAKALLRSKIIPKPNSEIHILSEMEKFIENFIETAKPNDVKTAKEVIPEILKYREKFGINNNVKILENFINQINPDNKKYILERGLSSLAQNMEKINSIVKDPEKSYKILGCLSVDNEKILPKLLEDSQNLKIYKVNHINDYLLTVDSKTFDFVFDDVLPQIQKYQNELKIRSSGQIVDIIEHTKPETLNIIEMVGKNASKFDFEDFSELILAINTNNKSQASFIFENYEKLGLDKAKDVKLFHNLINRNYDDLLNLIEMKG